MCDEVQQQTRAWIQGRNDAKEGRPRKAPSSAKPIVEAYASGYDSVSQDNS